MTRRGDEPGLIASSPHRIPALVLPIGAPQTIQHMWQLGVNNIALVSEAGALHYTARGLIAMQRKCDDIRYVELLERQRQHARGHLAREALPPLIGHHRVEQL